MDTASIKEIWESGTLWSDFSHYITVPQQGRCQLVGIRGRDASTEEAYRGNENSKLVRLMPISGNPQFDAMLEDSTLFTLVPNRLPSLP